LALARRTTEVALSRLEQVDNVERDINGLEVVAQFGQGRSERNPAVIEALS
jgi:hypothetical protein